MMTDMETMTYICKHGTDLLVTDECTGCDAEYRESLLVALKGEVGAKYAKAARVAFDGFVPDDGWIVCGQDWSGASVAIYADNGEALQAAVMNLTDSSGSVTVVDMETLG